MIRLISEDPDNLGTRSIIENSPAGNLIDLLEELNELSSTIKQEGMTAFKEKGGIMKGVKLLTEYRHLLKLRLDVLKKARTLTDEACFQRAVLKALNEADREVYEKAVAMLWELERDWNGDDDEDPLSLDDEHYGEDEPST